MTPTLKIGDMVEKVGGRYGGPGEIVGDTKELDCAGYKLWNVAMRVEGGYGRFVHVFPAAVLLPLAMPPIEPPRWRMWKFSGEERWAWPDWLKGHRQVAFAYDWSRAGNSQDVKDARMYVYTDRMRADIGDWIGLAPNGELMAFSAKIAVVMP